MERTKVKEKKNGTEWKWKRKRRSPLSREGAGIERELRFRVVLPHVFCIEETPQPPAKPTPTRWDVRGYVWAIALTAVITAIGRTAPLLM